MTLCFADHQTPVREPTTEDVLMATDEKATAQPSVTEDVADKSAETVAKTRHESGKYTFSRVLRKLTAYCCLYLSMVLYVAIMQQTWVVCIRLEFLVRFITVQKFLNITF